MTHSKTKEAILDIAQELIQLRGLNGMSYSDISQAVDIQKASIHYHFPTKEALVNAVLERYRADFNEHLDLISHSTAKPKQKLQKLLSLFESTIASGNNDKTCLCGMLSAEVYSLGDKTVEIIQSFLNDCIAALNQILKEGQTQGVFNLKGNAKGVSDLFLAALEGGLFMCRIDGGPKRFSQLLRQLEKIIS